jgi:hypothetical protein
LHEPGCITLGRKRILRGCGQAIVFSINGQDDRFVTFRADSILGFGTDGHFQDQRIDRAMAVRADDASGHGGLLEYCNYIQLFELRKYKEFQTNAWKNH